MATRSNVIVGRIRFVFILLALFALGLVFRLYTIQIVSGEEYKVRADRQYLRPTSNLLNRGSIYFTNKDEERVIAAYQQTGNIVIINPNLMTDSKSVYDWVNENIPINREDFEAKAGKTTDPYEEIAKKVDSKIGDKIAEKKLDGLQIYKQKWRTYPNNSLAAQVLGFMAYKDDDLAGRYGLELQYEDTLKRTNETAYANFFVEMFSNLQKKFLDDEKGEGDIVTTIEPTVQSNLEATLAEINKKWSPDHSGGIVMNPKTGEIVAMAASPTFDPNSFSGEADPRVFSNSLVENVYEMGSIIKPLTIAAGIDAGVITAKTTYFDQGFLVLDNRKISNFDGKGRGLINIQEVLNRSLNTGAAFIADKLGNERFSKYMKSFGLDKKTGIDLPFEAAPLVDNLNSPRKIEHATASYGQGIAMSPIATIRALGVLANHGRLEKPHVVSRIDYKTGLSEKIDTGEGEQIIKPETAEEVTRMLIEAVDTSLVNGQLRMEHYSIAAKTGTAQIPRTDGKGYFDDRYLHSFFGYFPAYDPQFIIFLFAYYPKQVNWASETLAPTFMEMVKYLINYYDIPPDR